MSTFAPAKLQQGRFGSSVGYKTGKPQVFMAMQLPPFHLYSNIGHIQNGQAYHFIWNEGNKNIT